MFRDFYWSKRWGVFAAVLITVGIVAGLVYSAAPNLISDLVSLNLFSPKISSSRSRSGLNQISVRPAPVAASTEVRTKGRRSGERALLDESGNRTAVSGVEDGTISNVNHNSTRWSVIGHIENINGDEFAVSFDRSPDCRPIPKEKVCGAGMFRGAKEYFLSVAEFTPGVSPAGGLLAADIGDFQLHDYVEIEAGLETLEAGNGIVESITGRQ